MKNAILNLKENQSINVACGLLPFDYGYENTGYCDLAVDVILEETGYYTVFEYLENENCTYEDYGKIVADFNKRDIDDLMQFLKNMYGVE